MTTDQEHWPVRIRGAGGEIRGAGMLLGTSHVLTCAHVVGHDVGGSVNGAGAPGQDLTVDFVGLRGVDPAAARVAAGCWVPPRSDDSGDVALLELDGSLPDDRGAPLHRMPSSWNQGVHFCGFPEHIEDGQWLGAKLAGPCGPGGEWVQINPEGQVHRGFSGAAVVDDRTGLVIGMVVTRYSDEHLDLAYMLPTETVLRYLPPLARWAGGIPVSDLARISDLTSWADDPGFARRVAAWCERREADVQVVVVGAPGSARSDALRRAILLSSREHRPEDTDELVAEAPEGTVPPIGSIDLAIDAAGKTVRQVAERIADRLGIRLDAASSASDQVRDAAFPMALVVYGVDDAAEPGPVLREVLRPLAERGCRLLLGFVSPASHSFRLASELLAVDPTARHPPSRDGDPTVQMPLEPPGRAGDDASPARAHGADEFLRLPRLKRLHPKDRIRGPEPLTRGRCGNRRCRIQIDLRIPGRKPRTKGFCPKCGTPFDFEAKLRPNDLVHDQYKVDGCLGHGGFGWAYLARDRQLNDRWVVLKGLINTNDEHAAEQAITEARRLTEQDHSNIVQVHNFVKHPDPDSRALAAYIVMEHANGWPLNEIAQSPQDRLEEGLRVEHVCAWGVQILAAFEHLHGRGRLYCDLKPDNVIQVSDPRGDDRLKLIDLGAVRETGDRDSPPVGTPGFQVSDHELREHGLTVRSDLYTVGRTLERMFRASEDWTPDPGGGAEEEPATDEPAWLGIVSFWRVLKRATAPHPRRFQSAADMSDQLRGVAREIWSLRHTRECPEPSRRFTPTAVLLDDGLGAVPPLDRWTKVPANVRRDAALEDGRPPAPLVATGLPVPRVDPADPAEAFLATVSTTVSTGDPSRLLSELRRFPGESVELELRACRAHLELGDVGAAAAALERGGVVLGLAADHDWRVAWHRGLLALARDLAEEAEHEFERVYAALPGEDAPKLALAFCAEQRGRLARAERFYDAVWQRDRSQDSAAFGRARIRLSNGSREGAVEALDMVPAVALHHQAARIAAVRVRYERLAAGQRPDALPTAADLEAVVERLGNLPLDGGATDGDERARLTASVREVGLAWLGERREHPLNGGEILGSPVTEKDLRRRLEKSYQDLARQTRYDNENGVLIDLANQTRPVSKW